MSIRQLKPVLDEGLIRVGGRLVNTLVSDKSKHSIIIPSKRPVTDMVIRYHHAEVGHMGQESVLSSLRREFWVIKGRTAVRCVVRGCMDYQRRKARLGELFMEDLPESRVTPQQHPFTSVGVDFFGETRTVHSEKIRLPFHMPYDTGGSHRDSPLFRYRFDQCS